MRYFSLILSVALIFAAVNCEETEKAEEVEGDVPEAKERHFGILNAITTALNPLTYLPGNNYGNKCQNNVQRPCSAGGNNYYPNRPHQQQPQHQGNYYPNRPGNTYYPGQQQQVQYPSRPHAQYPGQQQQVQYPSRPHAQYPAQPQVQYPGQQYPGNNNYYPNAQRPVVQQPIVQRPVVQQPIYPGQHLGQGSHVSSSSSSSSSAQSASHQETHQPGLHTSNSHSSNAAASSSQTSHQSHYPVVNQYYPGQQYLYRSAGDEDSEKKE